DDLFADLRQLLAAKLPAYMVPAEFVALPGIPLTPNGKVDRNALPHVVAKGTASRPAYVAPRNALEEQVAVVLQEVLGLDRLGVHDNLFDLGADSLMVVRAHG